MKVVNIDWDTTLNDPHEPVEVDLPTEVEVPDELEDDEVADYLSDIYGWCIFGLEIVRE